MLRVAIRRAGRCRIVEGASELWVGSDPGCAVVLTGRTVLAHHAALYERRGEVIVSASPRARVVVRGEVIRAPVVVSHGSEIGVGGYALRAAVVPDGRPTWLGAETECGRIDLEVGDRERGVRRYLTADRAWEVAAPTGIAPPSWWRRIEAAHPGARRLGPEAVAVPQPVGPEAVAVPRPVGRTAAELLHAVERRWIGLPAEAFVVLAARTLRGLEEWGGVHGGVWPERVALGRRGEVRLMPPGPDPEPQAPLADAFSSPARRLTGAESPADDRFALRALLERLDPVGCRPAWLSEAIDEGSFSLLRQASRASLDATAQHVARVVGLLDAAADEWS